MKINNMLMGALKPGKKPKTVKKTAIKKVKIKKPVKR